VKTLPGTPGLDDKGAENGQESSDPQGQCLRWAEQLSELQVIDLEGRGLFDPRPLALLPSAAVLRLGRNQFENIAFLADRPHFTQIDITGNLALDIDRLLESWKSTPQAAALPPLVVIGQNRQYQNRSPLMAFHPRDPGRPFLKACGSDTIPLETKKTFNALMAKTQALSCHQLWRRILMLDKLLLKQRGISDVAPLSHFSHLISLDLSGNPDLTDVSPLLRLESLKTLNLKGTGVRDVSMLLPLVQRNGLTIEL
jgi:hypothetical protein